MPQALKRHLCSLGGLLACALLLRIVFLLLAGGNAPLRGDELAYQQIAANLAAGRGLYQTNNPFFPGQALYAWQAPLYPLTLGVIYYFAGNNPLLARMFGVVVGTAMMYLIYDLARRMFRGETRGEGTERIALVAGFLVAIYPGLLTNAHLLLSETLFACLLVLAFDCVARALDAPDRRGTWSWIAGAGAVMGFATLARGIALYFIPLLGAWIAWSAWQRKGNDGDVPSPRTHLGSGIVAALLLGGVALAVVAPYTLRNAAVFRQFVLLETKGGVNLWLGNSPDTPPDFIRNVWKAGVREPMLGVLPRDEVSRDKAAYALAFQYIRTKPLTFIARMPVKFADFWGFERNLVDTAEETIKGAGWRSPAKLAAHVLSGVVYVLVMLSGVAGFVCADDDRWKLLFGVFVLYFLGVHLVVFGDGRFHLPLIPLFALYGGKFLVDVLGGKGDAVRQIHCTTTRVGIAVVVAASLVAAWGREAWTAWRVLRGSL